MQNIYNIIVGQTNEQLQDEAAWEATLNVFNTGQDYIGHLMILKKIFF